MRSTDEQLRIIRARAEELRRARRRRKAGLIGAGSACLSLALIVVLSLILPQTADGELLQTTSRYGSLLRLSSLTGYIVIGTLSFALGICVTLLFMHLTDRNRGGGDRK